MSIELQNRMLRLETMVILLTARIAALEASPITIDHLNALGRAIPRKGWPKGRKRGPRNGKAHPEDTSEAPPLG